jgi:putative zinc finger/helix-turn-helix YgiT family protein
MSTLCISCQQAELRPAMVKLSGVVRSEPYWVEMNGLKCPNCGYSTVDAKGMTEFSRLLSDKYRAEHDLLTSDEIVALRNRFDENQDQFAKRCNIGPATLKRIEKGKIQDEDTNRKIIEKTKTRVDDLQQYAFAATGETFSWLQGGCAPDVNSYSTQSTIIIYVTRPDTTVAGNSVEHIAATVPPYIANWRIRGENDRNTTNSAA